MFDDPIDAVSKRADITRINRWERRYTHLIAAELAVTIGIDDAIGAKNCAHRERIDPLEINSGNNA